MAIGAGVVQHTDNSRRRKTLSVDHAFTGNYSVTEVPDLTKFTNPKLLPAAYPGRVPTKVVVLNCPAGYNVEFLPAAVPTLANPGRFKVSTTAGAELAVAAYPAALLAAGVRIQVDYSGPTGAF